MQGTRVSEYGAIVLCVLHDGQKGLVVDAVLISAVVDEVVSLY